MLKSKIIDVLKTFTQEELKNFRNYINSPFHNSNKNVVKLFELIRKHGPGYDSPAIQKEKLFRKLYPSKKYSDIVIRILLSDLLKLSEDFLAYQRYIKTPLAEEMFLLEELKNRNLDSLFNKVIKEAEQHLDMAGGMNDAYFLNRYEIENLKVNYLISKDKQTGSGLALLKKGEYLVDYFLVNVMNIVQELNERAEVLNEKFSFNLTEEFIMNTSLDKVINYMKTANYSYHPIIEMHYYMYLSSLDHESDLYYLKFRESVVKNLHLFHNEEKFNLLLALESCCVSRLKTDRVKIYEDLIEVYELMLASNVFSESSKGYMQANLFRNIFYTAVVLKRYEWAEKFVYDYHDHLLPEQKNDMYNYTKALLNFEKDNFETALEFIGKVNHSFFVFKFEARVLMMKIYYELRSFEPALSLIDSFSHFLTKNKIVSDSFRDPFMFFNKYMKILIKISSENKSVDKKDLEFLKKEIQNSRHFFSRRWILEKTDELSLR